MATKNGTNGPDTIDGTVFRDTLQGLGGNDTIIGHDADDLLKGNVGDDALYGGDGDDQLLGGNGADLLYGDSGRDELKGGSGNDTLYGEGGNDTLFGGDGDDFLSGGSLVVVGSATKLQAGHDILNGGTGNDKIVFSWEDISVNGGDDDDILQADPMKSSSTFTGTLVALDGGDGIDTLILTESDNEFLNQHRQRMNADLNAGTVTITYDPDFDGAGNLDYFTSSIVNVENLSGGYAADVLYGNGADNVLTGKGGDDDLRGRDGNDILFDEYVAAGEAIFYTFGDDQLRGGNGDDIIHSTGGHDMIYGGHDNDVIHVYDLVNQVVDGGDSKAGDELVLYDDYHPADPNVSVLVGDQHQVVNIERLTLTSAAGAHITLAVPMLNSAENGAFAVSCEQGDDVIDGSRASAAVALSLYGHRGQDKLIGGDGDDTLDGGDNVDTLDGGAGADHLLGGDGNDVLLHSAGSDTFGGGRGVDLVDYGTVGPPSLPGLLALSVDLKAGTAVVDPFIGLAIDTLISIEDVNGSDFNDSIAGNNRANTLFGAKGDDLLRGAGGNDAINGGNGADTLIGGRGRDTLDGGHGSDTADFSDADVAIAVDLGITGPQSTGQGNDTFISIENLTGGGQSDFLSGNQQNNRLAGGDGDDVLSGHKGRDTLEGGLGADWLTGGARADTFVLLSVAESPAGNTRDHILDFSGTGGDGDRIDVSAVAAFTYIGSAWFSGTAGELRFGNNGVDGFLTGDTDGDGAGDFTVVLEGVTSLAAGDLILV